MAHRSLAPIYPKTRTRRVFISYSHDSDAHGERILQFANRLRREGVDAVIDQYEDVPREGWTIWTEKQIRDSDYVILCCTKTYLRRVMKEEARGAGLGVCWEANIIYQYLYEDGSQNQRFLPVVLADKDVRYIPTPLRGFARYEIRTGAGYESLYRRITDQPRTVKPPIGKLRKLASRS
ncbi:MAG TPA: toll/interleukin-1 receptor domain-containing protein [Bryobacteraceae bacterium]|nr:toll/interleukin-1 receptor domain-containing protein [Bryobacteraceae bacterium]